MGFEYRIRHQPGDVAAWNAFASNLDNPKSDSGRPAFTVELTDEGIYFCDHGSDDAAPKAFYRIIQHVASSSDRVVVEEI